MSIEEDLQVDIDYEREHGDVYKSYILEGELNIIKKLNSLNRVEVINHSSSLFEKGRFIVYRGKIETSLQDGDKTLKIFI